MEVAVEARCTAPVPGAGCPHTARSSGLCPGHLTRQQRGRPIDTPIKTRREVGACECGSPIEIAGKCRPCYRSDWRKAKQLAGGRSRTNYVTDGDWFDWVMVERAVGGEAMPRPLTNPERLHVLYVCIQQGLGDNAARLGQLARMEPPAALSLAERIESGEVKVMGRDWLGRPTEWLSAPVSQQ